MATLTSDDILLRSKTKSLESVKSLQYWAMKLNDVSILAKVKNLEVLNLSCNDLTTLCDIGQCKNLRQLYLRKNSISKLEEVQHLQTLPYLQVLWLAGNPISSLPNYRQKVLACLPQLHQLDQTVVSEQERQSVVIISNPNKEQSITVTTAILTLLPLLDKDSLHKVYSQIQIMLKQDNNNDQSELN